MKKKYVHMLLMMFMVYMLFEGFLKYYTNYHPILHGAKYIFAILFLKIFAGIRDKKTPYNGLLSVYLLACFLQFFNPYMLSVGGFFVNILGIFFELAFLPLLFIAQAYIEDERDINKFLIFIICLVVIDSAFAHYQYMLGLPTVIKNGIGDGYLKIMPYKIFDTNFARRVVLYRGPIAFDIAPPVFWYLPGAILSMVFVLISKKLRAIASVVFVIIFIAMMLSNIRVGMYCLIFAMGMFAYLVFTKAHRARIVMLLLVVGFLSIGIFQEMYSGGGETFKFEMRKDARDRLDEIIKSPMERAWKERGVLFVTLFTELIPAYPFGIGLRAGPASGMLWWRYKIGVPPVYDAGYMDNLFAWVQLDTGLFGVIIMLFLLVKICQTGFNACTKVKDYNLRVTSMGLYSIILAIILAAGSGAPLFFSPTNWTFWFFNGMLLKIYKMDKEKSLLSEE